LHCGGFGLRVAISRASGVREEFTQFRLTHFLDASHVVRFIPPDRRHSFMDLIFSMAR
jgi:hypothetical protein